MTKIQCVKKIDTWSFRLSFQYNYSEYLHHGILPDLPFLSKAIARLESLHLCFRFHVVGGTFTLNPIYLSLLLYTWTHIFINEEIMLQLPKQKKKFFPRGM